MAVAPQQRQFRCQAKLWTRRSVIEVKQRLPMAAVSWFVGVCVCHGSFSSCSARTSQGKARRRLGFGGGHLFIAYLAPLVAVVTACRRR